MSSAPPYATVLVVALAHQRGPQQQIGEPAQLVQGGRRQGVGLLLGAGYLGREVPLDAAGAVQRSGQLGRGARADVLADDAAVPSHRARVVPAASARTPARPPSAPPRPGGSPPPDAPSRPPRTVAHCSAIAL